MKLYVQLMIILFFSLIGEAISTFFQLPVPGSIIGLVLLFLALEFKVVRLRHIFHVGEFLLANMTILFLPAGVGVMNYIKVILPNILPIAIITFGALILNILTIAFIVTFVKNRYEGDYPVEEEKHD